MHLSKQWIKFAVTGAMAATLSFTAASALYAGEVTASSLNVRSAPGGAAIGTLARGTKVAVISNSTEWYEIAVNGQTAYVSGAYINWIPDCEFDLGTGVVKCSTTVNFRSLPNTSSQILGSLTNGQKVNVIGIAQGWYKAEVNGKTGFICADYLDIKGGTAADKSTVTGSTTVTTTEETSAVRQEIIDYAAQFLGTPYVYGGSTPDGFDCSGFTSYVYKNTVCPIARTSSDQRATTKNISMSELLPGDLVFFGSGNTVSHVGIYVGNGQFIHSPHTGSVVKYDTLSSGSYYNRFICGGRVLND